MSRAAPAASSRSGSIGKGRVVTKDAVPVKRKIVVVNDTQEILRLFQDLLEEEGYEVHTYSYAFDDVAEIKRLRPDLVILDLLVNNEDHGWQLLQKLKMDPGTVKTPVIVCSAAVRLLRDLEGHLKEKGVGVVIKPFDLDDLLRAVDHAWSQLARDAADTGTATAPNSPRS